MRSPEIHWIHPSSRALLRIRRPEQGDHRQRRGKADESALHVAGADGVGSPRDSMSRLAQLKNAAAWITSEIARSSRPARRRRSTCSGPKAIGVAVSATEAATMAF